MAIAKATNVSAKRNSDTSITVTWKNPSQSETPTYVVVLRSDDNEPANEIWGDGDALEVVEYGATSYTDTSVSSNHRYKYAIAYVKGKMPGTSGSSSSVIVTSDYTSYVYTTPSTCTNVTNTRNSDNKNTITWAISSPSSVQQVIVQRKTSGSAWATIATLSGAPTSYVDSSTSAGNFYQYGVIAKNSAGQSTIASSATTYNTPTAPTKVLATCEGATSPFAVVISDNTPISMTATGIEIERSSDNQNWVAVASLAYESVGWSYTDSLTDVGTYYYRVRYTRGSLVSPWTVSDATATAQPPLAPTLIIPQNSDVFDVAESMVFMWLHNSVDGSAQTEAEISISTDGGVTWNTYVSQGPYESWRFPNPVGSYAFPLNTEVLWYVRTKGVYDEYSPSSGVYSFTAVTAPEIVVADIGDNDTIKSTPVHIEFTYSDQCGELAEAIIRIVSKTTNECVFSESIGTRTSIDIPVTDWLPKDGESYYVYVDCRSTSRAYCPPVVKEVSVSFALPKAVLCERIFDDKTGYVNISMSLEDREDRPEPVSMVLYRVVDGIETPIYSGEVISSFEDRYTPINTYYRYKTVTLAEFGALNTCITQEIIDISKYAYFYYNDKVARASISPNENMDITSPNEQLVHYAGRTYPVAYDDDCLSESGTFAATLKTPHDARAFRKLMTENKGRCVYKSPMGSVFHAKCSVSFSLDYATLGAWGAADIKINRIDGKAL